MNIQFINKKSVLAAMFAILIVVLLGSLSACASSSASPTATVTVTETTGPTVIVTNGPTATVTATVTSSQNVSNFVPAVANIMGSMVKVEVTYGPNGAPGNPSATGGAGTGWAIQPNMIVTNNHVVESAQTVNVVYTDGTTKSAEAIKTNPGKDIAVIKISANLPTVTTGDSSQLQIGQWVAVVGNALNMGIRTSVGVVSQLNLQGNYDNISIGGLIETDAAINPGNSGGVMIDIEGNVVGIPNASVQDQSLDVENFGYAININEALPVINNLISQMP